ncbi:hypothetical protein CRYUN_Cryun16bG0090000 [Craigia yunnanensis]
MRGRSCSYSPSPPRDYGRRRRSPSPRGLMEVVARRSAWTFWAIWSPQGNLSAPRLVYWDLGRLVFVKDFWLGKVKLLIEQWSISPRDRRYRGRSYLRLP